jgi:hypothetical protein
MNICWENTTLPQKSMLKLGELASSTVALQDVSFIGKKVKSV